MANLSITYPKRDRGMLCSIELNEPKLAYRRQPDQKPDVRCLELIARDEPSPANNPAENRSLENVIR
jgi:hypothetical protein